MGIPIAIVASVAAVRTRGQLGWGVAALTVSVLEAIVLLAGFIQVGTLQ